MACTASVRGPILAIAILAQGSARLRKRLYRRCSIETMATVRAGLFRPSMQMLAGHWHILTSSSHLITISKDVSECTVGVEALVDTLRSNAHAAVTICCPHWSGEELETFDVQFINAAGVREALHLITETSYPVVQPRYDGIGHSDRMSLLVAAMRSAATLNAEELGAFLSVVKGLTGFLVMTAMAIIPPSGPVKGNLPRGCTAPESASNAVQPPDARHDVCLEATREALGHLSAYLSVDEALRTQGKGQATICGATATVVAATVPASESTEHWMEQVKELVTSRQAGTDIRVSYTPTTGAANGILFCTFRCPYAHREGLNNFVPSRMLELLREIDLPVVETVRPLVSLFNERFASLALNAFVASQRVREHFNK